MLLKWLGGLRENANIEDINLAYKLEDGMKVHIPTNEEKEKEKQLNSDVNNKNDNVDSYDKNIINNSSNTKKININTATQEQLESLPGIGPATASKIISYRKEKGKFNKIEDIKEVSGIGDAKFDKMKDFITIK